MSVTGPSTQEAVGDAVLEDDDIELDSIVDDDDDIELDTVVEDDEDTEEVWLAVVLALWPTDVLEMVVDPLVVWSTEELETVELGVVEDIDAEDMDAEDVGDETVVVVGIALLAPGM